MTIVQTSAPGQSLSPADIRRRIRRMRVAANGRVDPATVYSVTLALAMTAALLGQPVVGVIWPAAPPAAPTAGVPAGAGLVLLGFYAMLRQVGPLSISRSDATWLLPAPVSRRLLLSPSLHLTSAAAVVLGGLTGLAVTGHVATRPVAAPGILTGVAAGSAAAVLLASVAVAGQRRPAVGRRVDVLGGVAGTGLVVLAVGSAMTGGYPLPLGAPPELLAGVLASSALAGAGLAVVAVHRRLDGWPAHSIAEASVNLGAYADAVYAVEPSFLAEMSTRRYWRRRTGIATTRLLRSARIPPLVVQDLLITRRKAPRLWWLACAAGAPALAADGPSWLLIGLVLLGGLAAAGLTMESTHSDAANPAMLRLLGVPGRRVVASRLLVPAVLAAAWCGLALGGLQAAGALAGPWWLLGLAAGPAVASAALRRAKASASSLGSILIETPLGAFPSGMLLWLTNGVDALALWTLPVSICLVSARPPDSLGWEWVLAQAVAAGIACLVLLRQFPARASRL